MRSALYHGTLVHARRSPAEHVFRYPVSYWLVDLDELPELERRFRVISHNRPNLVSFRNGDHFEGGPWKESVRAFAGDPSIDRVLVLTQPRIFGFVFNPVSFYWCYRGDGSLACMVAELNNTFGERLPELLQGDSLQYEHRKRLHVSPFFGLEQVYRYSFSEPGDTVFARIEVHEGDAMPLQAVLSGKRIELDAGVIASSLARHPLMPLRIFTRIHTQALRLWLKRVPFHRKPAFVPGEGSIRA